MDDITRLHAAWQHLNRALAELSGPSPILVDDDGPPDEPGFGWVGGQWNDAARHPEAQTAVLKMH